LDRNALYGVLTSQANTRTAPSNSFTVFGYDLGTGHLTKGPTLAYVDGMTVAAGSLWAVAASVAGSPGHLYRIDPAGLSVERTWALTAPSVLPGAAVGAEVSAAPGGLVWAAAGKDLYAVNPATAQIARQRTLGGDITSLSSSPTGQFVYLALQSATVPLSVVEVDTTTATPIRKRSFPNAIAGGTVTAAPGGVWVTYRTGMLGQGVRLDANALQTTAPESLPYGSVYDQSMGVSISISDQIAWVASATSGACADPPTPAVRASTDIQIGSPVAANHTLYATTPTGLAIIGPPRSCFE
jgi:hypothetical protein